MLVKTSWNKVKLQHIQADKYYDLHIELAVYFQIVCPCEDVASVSLTGGKGARR